MKLHFIGSPGDWYVCVVLNFWYTTVHGGIDTHIDCSRTLIIRSSDTYTVTLRPALNRLYAVENNEKKLTNTEKFKYTRIYAVERRET
jgi:hypothetical protein